MADEEEVADQTGFRLGIREFADSEELLKLIAEITEVSCADVVQRELGLEAFGKIVDRYQEQPHVVDPHLERLVGAVLNKAREPTNSNCVTDQAFAYFYMLVKMRGYKVVIRYLPHEVADLVPLLSLLEAQSVDDPISAPTRYGLLLWLSIVVKIPFQMSRFDAPDATSSVVDRIVETSKKFLWTHDNSQEAAALLLSTFITRPDVKTLKMGTFVEWVLEQLPTSSAETHSASELARLHGTLTSLALLYKHGRREDLLPYAPAVLSKIFSIKLANYPVSTVRRLAVKIVNRAGLSFLKTRLADWRYSRGARSLTDNLSSASSSDEPLDDKMESMNDSEEEEVPETLEEVLEFLLEALKDRETIVRWSAAKGVGRVTGRLPREYADQVVGSVLELFSPLEGDGAWHGACLTLAELGRRGLLLPERLSQVVPVVIKALVYEERRGNFAVGAHVRDAACYVCWSFARAYDPSVVRPYVNDIASALLVTTLFDREVNCRRAASAAFQENVGRQGEFPHGIEILTTADYFAVGKRSNAFLEVALSVAIFPEYTTRLIDHLVSHKIYHWDPEVRQLAGASLAALTEVAPDYITSSVLPKIVDGATSSRMEERHGALIALGDVVLALSQWSRSHSDAWTPRSIIAVLSEPVWRRILESVPKLGKSTAFKGMAGEWTKKACCHFIQRASEARLPIVEESVSVDLKGIWLEVIYDVLPHGDQTIASLGIDALPHLCNAYFDPNAPEFDNDRRLMIQFFMAAIRKVNLEKTRQGHARALANLPAFMYRGVLDDVLESLRRAAESTPETVSWAEGRRDAVTCLSVVVTTVGFEKEDLDNDAITQRRFDEVVATVLASLNDYTLDSRGDIGSLVREAGVSALNRLIAFAAAEAPSYLTPDFIAAATRGIVQQACEKIDRTRGVAGSAFANILWHEPRVPHVPRLDDLRTIFSSKLCDGVVWTSPSDTFPLFGKLLRMPEYAFAILLGFVVSAGGLTESLVVHAGETLVEFFDDVVADEDTFRRASRILLDVLEAHDKQDRVTVPFLKMTEHLLSSGCFESVVHEPHGEAFAIELVNSLKREVKASKNPAKIMAAADVLCGCLQFPIAARRKALSQLSLFLGHRYPRVRKATAEKLYEALLTYDDVVDEEEQLCEDPSDDDDVAGSKLDRIMNLLSETAWDDKDIDGDVKPARNKLCLLFGIEPPKPILKKECP